jgi:hypothetical protein
MRSLQRVPLSKRKAVTSWRRDGEEDVWLGLWPEEVGLNFNRLLRAVAAQEKLASLDLSVVL